MFGGYGIHQFGFGVFRKQIKRTASYVSASFPAYFLASQNADYNSFRAIVDDYLPEGVTALTATPEDWETAYDAYVSDVQETLGTTTVGTNGFFMWIPTTALRDTYYIYTVYSSTFGYLSTGSWLVHSDTSGVNRFVEYKLNHPVTAPVDGTYTFAAYAQYSGWDALVFVPKYGVPFSTSCDLNTSGGAVVSSPYPAPTAVTAGTVLISETSDKVCVRVQTPWESYGQTINVSFRVGYWVVPTVYSINEYTTSIGGGAGRLGNVPITFATMDEEENLTPIENTYIVNEGDNEYYDIVNNVTYDMSRFTYDYSTRTYEVTYIDNDSVTQTTNVTYGDEYITVVQGGNTYNYYYAISA